MSKKSVLKISLSLALLFGVIACQSDLEPQDHSDVAGTFVIKGYATDTVYLKVGDMFLENREETKFIKEIDLEYKFVYQNGEAQSIDVLSNESGEEIITYSFTAEAPTLDNYITRNTIAFLYTPDFLMKNVYNFEPGELSASGNVGYKFMFPAMNKISNSGYIGALDGIITNYVTKEQLAVVENITTDNFSDFVEFPYSSPNIIEMELVKHGTTESYVEGETIIVQMIMKKSKSRLIVLNETSDSNEAKGFRVTGNMDLTSYFDY